MGAQRRPFFFVPIRQRAIRGHRPTGKPPQPIRPIRKNDNNMKWLTLPDIKQQLRIEPDFNEEDTLLESYGESAEATVLNYLNRSFINVMETYGKVPDPVVHASKMLVDLSYQYRSPINTNNMALVPYSFDLLLKPYMALASTQDSEMQTVTKGSDVKIEFTADLPDGLKLADVDFSGKVLNADEKDKEMAFQKADCISVDDGESYVVLVDTEEMGIGTLLLKLVVMIPDTDYPSGTCKEVININPHIQVTG